MIVQTIEISLSKGRAPELLAHLGESNRQIEMIPDVELPESAGAEIDIVKPDGTFAIQTAAITDGHIIVTLPDQACTVKGISHYILKITDSGTVIYSAYGNLFVDDHLITEDMIESIAEANGYQFPDDFLTDDKLEANPSGSATDTLYRLKLFDTIYGVGGGGADVEANPTGTPTGTLDALRVDDNIYELEKPIPVEANPSGSATDTLKTLKIGSNIYNIDKNIVYSTEEHVVGTWIDGSTLYEKTIINESLSYVSVGSYKAYNVAHLSLNTGIVMWESGCVHDRTDDRMYTLPYDRYYSNTDKIVPEVFATSSEIQVWVTTQSDASYSLDKAYVTIRYTKTV